VRLKAFTYREQRFRKGGKEAVFENRINTENSIENWSKSLGFLDKGDIPQEAHGRSRQSKMERRVCGPGGTQS